MAYNYLQLSHLPLTVKDRLIDTASAILPKSIHKPCQATLNDRLLVEFC